MTRFLILAKVALFVLVLVGMFYGLMWLVLRDWGVKNYPEGLDEDKEKEYKKWKDKNK